MAEKSKSRKSEKARIHITGMTCTTCAATIEKGLAETLGVEQANVSFASEKASIEYDPAGESLDELMHRWRMSEQDLGDLVEFIKTLR